MKFLCNWSHINVFIIPYIIIYNLRLVRKYYVNWMAQSRRGNVLVLNFFQHVNKWKVDIKIWQINIIIWQVNIKIWQVNIIIWQVVAELCHHKNKIYILKIYQIVTQLWSSEFKCVIQLSNKEEIQLYE